MAKYSVGGVEVIGDDGTMPWEKVSSRPPLAESGGRSVTNNNVTIEASDLRKLLTVTGNNNNSYTVTIPTNLGEGGDWFWVTMNKASGSGTLTLRYQTGDSTFTNLDQISAGTDRTYLVTKQSGGTWYALAVRSISNCACDCACDCVCFVPGSLVLMADGTHKAIEDMVVGDRVQGMTQVNTVARVIKSTLSYGALMGFDDGSLQWSSPHPFWVKRGDQQYWWSAYAEHWARHANHFAEQDGQKPLFDPSMVWTSQGVPELFAHVSGWLERTPYAVIAPGEAPDRVMHSMRVDGDETYIVNGWVVGGGASTSWVTRGEPAPRAFDWRGLNRD